MCDNNEIDQAMAALNEQINKLNADGKSEAAKENERRKAIISTSKILRLMNERAEAGRSEHIKSEAKNDSRFSSQMIVAVIAAVAAIAAVIVPIILAFSA